MRARTQQGMVTAEAAMVLPALVAVAGLLAWLITVGVAQIQCVDAARDAARALARAEDRAVVLAAARSAAPDGAGIDVDQSASRVTVRVRYTATPPGRLLDGVLRLQVGAESTLPAELPGATDAGG